MSHAGGVNTTLLPDFETRDVDVDGVRIHLEIGGSGPPLLLLHGYPQTHVMWHRVAPSLARDFTVIAPDLRGYGDSARPPAGARSEGYAKRAMAADQAGLMSALGFDTFAAVGHDRGARVLHRLCLDHPDRVTRAAFLDIVPTRYVFDNVDRALATKYYHWFFLAQPADLPERLIGGDPEAWLRRAFSGWSADADAFDAAAVAEYLRCFADPEVIAATCADYRAGAGIDLDHDAVDAAAGNRVRCPALVLWGAHGFVGSRYDVLDIWQGYADDVRGQSLECGHFVAEEDPAGTLAGLTPFLTS
jgi:haloacetate dehalogenase